MRVLREAFGVVHPLLLKGMPAAPTGIDDGPIEITPHPDCEPVELDQAYSVECETELVDLVDRTVAAVTGSEPVRDEDGDWPIRFTSRPVWVRVLHGEPLIRVFSVIVRGIRHTRSAHREVAILNRDARLLRYHLDGDVLIAELNLPAGPFVPEHLNDSIGTFHHQVEKVARDFASRTGCKA